MSDRILINGVDKGALYFEGSLRALRDIGHMNTCTLRLVTDAGTYLPTEGVDLEVLLKDDTQFCGIIKSVGVERLDRSTTTSSKLLITITAENFRDVASRRTISGTWESPDYTCAGDIVRNIQTNILSVDDVGVSRIDDGAAIELYSVVVRSVDEILDDLAEISGYKWYISDDKDLVFTDNDPDVTDIHHIDSTDDDFTDFEILSYTKDTTEYANKIFIRGGIGDDGYQYVDVLSDDVEIAARATIEGGTGVHGYVIDNPEIVDAAMGLEAMTAELAKRSRVPQTLVFKSRQAFEPGFKILVKLPAYGISSLTTFMIEQVTITEKAGTLYYQVSATYKNPTMTTTHRVPGAKEFFEGMIGGSSGSVAGISSTVTKFLNNVIASVYGQNSAQVVVDTSEDVLATGTLTTTWVTGVSNSTIILGSTVVGTPSQDCKLTLRLWVDGGPQTPVNEHVCYGLVKESTAFTIAVPVPAGTHTIQLQAVVDQGTFTVDANGAQFWALAVGVGVGVAVDYFPKINLSLATPDMPVIPDSTGGGQSPNVVLYSRLAENMDGIYKSDASSGILAGTVYGGATLSDECKLFSKNTLKMNGGGLQFSHSIYTDGLPGNGKFTIALWFYLTGQPDVFDSIFDTRIGDTTGQAYIHFGSRWAGTTAIPYLYAAGGGQALAQNNLTYNTWHHLAVVGDGGNDGNRKIKCYIDGTKIIEAYRDYNIWNNDQIRIGFGQDGGASHNGFITDFLYAYGVELWTENFPVPTSPFNMGEWVDVPNPNAVVVSVAPVSISETATVPNMPTITESMA